MFRSSVAIIRELYAEPGQSYTLVEIISKITSLRLMQYCGSMLLFVFTFITNFLHGSKCINVIFLQRP
jgi:hypothetical protein